MKRFITLGLSTVLVSSLFVPGAIADETSQTQEQQPQTTEQAEQQPTSKPAVKTTEKRAANVSTPEQTDTQQLSERDRLVMQYRLLQVIPSQE